MTELLEIKQTRTCPFRPQSDGQVERMNRSLIDMLAKFCSHQQEDWDTHLPYLFCAYRCTPHESTGCSPNLLMFGREITLPIDLMYDADPTSTTPCPVEYVEWIRQAAQENFERVRDCLERSAQRQKRNYDKGAVQRHFAVGDWVLRFYPPNLSKSKLNPKYIGPYLVTAKLSEVTYRVQRSRHSNPLVLHADHLKRFHSESLPASWLPKVDKIADNTRDQANQTCFGPTALIQFRIWQRGAVDLRQLREKLMGEPEPMPTVTKVQHNLQAEFSVEYILHELQSAVHAISSKVTLKVFKVLHYANPASTPMSVQFFPCKPQPMGSQKFMPLCREAGNDKDKEGIGAFAGMGQTFVPRQRLLLLVAYDKKLVVYMYNWASDVAAMLEQKVTKLVQWHNARTHILSSILSQKMGLFHHNMFTDLTYTPDQNPYTQTLNDIDNLIRFTAPPRDINRRHNSVSTQSRTLSRMLNQHRPFDDTYKNLMPARTMQQRSIQMADPVARHGMQAQEMRTRYRKDVERVMKLQQLYFGWLQKNTANPPVSDDYVVLLKQASRLFHYCATPILFCQNWRQRVLEQNTKGADITPPAPPPPPPSPEKEQSKSFLYLQRSRHSSGASISSGRTKRSDSQDGGRGKKLAESAPPPAAVPEGQGRRSSSTAAADEAWHHEMCHDFLMQYRNYLTSEFGFICLQLQPSLAKKGPSRTSSDESREDPSQRHAVINLQKTLTSGIILMELSMRSQYFVLKMYVIDYGQLGINTNQQMQLLFVDECLKYKDLIHVHSFAHDYHLRCVHNYLTGQQTLLPPGFHLSNFLTEFLQVYPIPPSFARNCLAQETALMQRLPCPGAQLFTYMRKQIRQFDMTVFRMIPPDVLEPTRLLQPSLDSDSAFEGLRDFEGEVYNMALVVTQDTSHRGQKDELKIRFLVVLTRQRDCHPKRTLEKKFGDLRSGIFLTSSQTGKIEEMVQNSKVKCRRDYLWNRMVAVTGFHGKKSEKEKEKEKKAIEKEKKAKTDEHGEAILKPLTFPDFVEMLELVRQQPLNQVDSRLAIFSNMPTSWYSSLLPVLAVHFGNDCRFVSSEDGSTHYAIILNHKWLDVFILMSVDQVTGCTALNQVMRDPYTEPPESAEGASPSILPGQLYRLIEDFVNVCCYHLWTSIL
nr:hypothetical protein BaRGS_034137 [Batillaria attramentaria]